MPIKLEDLDDLEELFLDPPKRPVLRARPDFNERLWKRLQEDRRARRTQKVRYISLAAAATIAGGAYLWTPLVQELAPVAAIRPPVSAPAVSSAKSTPVAAPATQKVAPKPEASQQAAHQAPANQGFVPPKLVSAPPANVPDTTGTFPAPRPEIQPYRPPIDLAVERVGADGRPIDPAQPQAYYRKGNRHPPLAPPGTPKIHDQITVTPPATTTTDPATTTNPPAETTTTNPPAEAQPPSKPRR